MGSNTGLQTRPLTIIDSDDNDDDDVTYLGEQRASFAQSATTYDRWSSSEDEDMLDASASTTTEVLPHPSSARRLKDTPYAEADFVDLSDDSSDTMDSASEGTVDRMDLDDSAVDISSDSSDTMDGGSEDPIDHLDLDDSAVDLSQDSYDTMDSTSDDIIDLDELEDPIPDLVDLTLPAIGSSDFSSWSVELPKRCQKVREHQQRDGCLLRSDSDMCVEYRYTAQNSLYYHGDLEDRFFLIKQIWKSIDGDVYLQGWMLRRNTYFEGQMPLTRNEVAILIHAPDAREDVPLNACMTTLALPEVCIERKIMFTNVLPPSQAELHALKSSQSARRDREHGLLTCRWVVIQKGFNNSSKLAQETVWRRLRQDECRVHGVADADLRDRFRHTGKYASSARRHQASLHRGAMRYTTGDICSGGGGTLLAQSLAGFKPAFALDSWLTALQTLEANGIFRRCEKIHQDVFDFLTIPSNIDRAVDLLHVSFPCQSFSPANRGGKDDEKNHDVSLAARDLLLKTTPRLVSSEQTSGITQRKWDDTKNAIVQQYTSLGYSVRMRVENLANFGNVHARKRVIMVASCPGEPLPTMLEPTHGPRLQSYVTVADVLEARKHDVPLPGMDVHSILKEPSQPWDAEEPLRRCVMTNGAGLHPSGERTFTLFELAGLQHFPPWFRFAGRAADIKRQIGNAVPPSFGVPWFKHLLQALKDEDNKVRQ
ncbi:hypothetical protein AMS68_005904 [Peltaster fructicola]|uniref:DNA (cytosine-5-)-methyltransferase n=1 Tax=Peltaster fructicola TaxID=286661 RepID=A0A6H0Y056_9PEZI|nr:hypothetical protein AMS68_005904 [Peltaster fructicola]